MAVLSELEVTSQVSVRGKPPVAPNTAAELTDGRRHGSEARRTGVGDGGRTAIWLGPDEWLVLGGSEAEYAEAAAAVDVSANRVVFALDGEDAAEVLARGCSLDLHPAVFAVGRCAQTMLARAQVILVRSDARRFLVLVRPSFAPYLRAWLEDAIAGTRSAEAGSGASGLSAAAV